MKPRFALYHSRFNSGSCWVRDDAYGRVIMRGSEADCLAYLQSLTQDMEQ